VEASRRRADPVAIVEPFARKLIPMCSVPRRYSILRANPRACWASIATMMSSSHTLDLAGGGIVFDEGGVRTSSLVAITSLHMATLRWRNRPGEASMFYPSSHGPREIEGGGPPLLLWCCSIRPRRRKEMGGGRRDGAQFYIAKSQVRRRMGSGKIARSSRRLLRWIRRYRPWQVGDDADNAGPARHTLEKEEKNTRD
jgi:hypothetical protein